ncbi:MAG: hypothetical protein ACI9YB_000248 [Halioglobus sp.]
MDPRAFWRLTKSAAFHNVVTNALRGYLDIPRFNCEWLRIFFYLRRRGRAVKRIGFFKRRKSH